MPRISDVFGRHAQPRALTAAAASFGAVAGGAGGDTTGQALFTGSAYFDGAVKFAPGGRIRFDGTHRFDSGNAFHEPA